MGKGDKKSRKGKISMGSHGVTRPRKKAKSGASTVKNETAKKATTPKKVAAPKKVADKKAPAKKAK